MAPVEGRREVPDSEDEPMTSSPVNVSDGIADKLFAMAHVPNQDAEDAPQEATRRHQATPETVANVTAERIDGLDADRNIASFNVNAPRDEQTDVQHTTTTASPKSTGEASDNAANLRLADAASYPRSATNDLNPRQDALIADTMQKSQQIAASGPTAELEATTASGTRPLLEDSVVTVRDGIKMAEEQYELANDEVVCGNAREQSSPQPMNASNASNEPKEELVRGRLQADNSKHTPSNGAEVSEIRPDEYSTSQARLSTLVTSQADTPTLSSQTSRTECVTSAESRDHGDNVDDTTQQIPKDGIPRLNCGISGGELDVKHAVISGDVYDNTGTLATGPHTNSADPVKERVLEYETSQNSSMSLPSSSSVGSRGQEDVAVPEDTSKTIENHAASTNMDIEPHPTETESASGGADSEATSSGAVTNIDIPQSSNTVAAQIPGKEDTASSSSATDPSTNASTAPTSTVGTLQDSSQAHMKPLYVAFPTKLDETTKVAQDAPVATSDLSLLPQLSASIEPPAASTTSTPAKTPQEVMLAELKAQKSAMLASLAALPAIQVLMEEHASSDVEMVDGDDEPTEANIMAAANKIVKDHIKLLHEYNELKDVGQGLMGLIADQRGVRIIEVQEEFGIEAQD